jgi:predicted DNA-binding transcriptional regulator AlpA
MSRLSTHAAMLKPLEVITIESGLKPTVYNRIKTGLPVSYALGEKSPRFIKSEIDSWLSENREKSE